MIAEIERSGFCCNIIETDAEFISQVNTNNIVVLDGYHFSTDYQQQIKAVGANLVCIDDLHDKKYYADLIINHAPGVTPLDYKTPPYTQFALGPEFALLRPAFLEQAKKEKKIGKVETVMICFGGSDYKNLTLSTLKIVAEFINFRKIIVITGDAYIFFDSLNLFVNNDKRIIHNNAVDEAHMLSIMLDSDLVIVPASGILLEALAAGCLAISGISAENQKFVYSNYKNSGFIIDAADFNEPDLKKAIEQSFTLSLKEHKVFDGNSGKRILNCFLQLDTKSKIKLRKVNHTDISITYNWAANPDIRAYSFIKHAITKEEHVSWFANKLEDLNCFYYIAEIDDLKVGTIRFDIHGNEAIVSYLIAPEHQGKGLGQTLLIQGLQTMSLMSNKLKIRKIVGYVIKSNIASVKAFERLGFSRSEKESKIKFEMSL